MTDSITARRSVLKGGLLTSLAGLAAAGLLPTLGGAWIDDGQGTAVPGSNTSKLQPGTHLFGPRFDAAAALGKIVVLEIGGS